MRLVDYIKDKYKEIILSMLSLLIVLTLLTISQINGLIILFVTFIFILNLLTIFIYNFVKRKIFYNSMSNLLKNLDQKYLITEMVNEPNFIDGKIFLEYLYDIDKSMHEYVNNYKNFLPCKILTFLRKMLLLYKYVLLFGFIFPANSLYSYDFCKSPIQ